MTSMREDAGPAGAGWRRVAALAFAIAIVGVPINNVAPYALLLIVTLVIFTGEVSARASAWFTAAAIVFAAVSGQWLISPPRIAEGHNVFLPGPPDGALQRGLPTEVYRHMADEFEAQYPSAVRCLPGAAFCWQGSHPERAFAFSADGIFHPSDLSRAAPTIDFSDPVWLRLGFINELRYNWYASAPDVHRGDRDRRFWMGLRRWHLAMPWFEMIRLPEAFVGGELCWRGELMWEGADEHFAALPEDNCRAIAPGDAGRRVFGIAIKPDTLAMHLTPPWRVRLLQFVTAAIELAAAFGLIVVLVRLKARRTILPFLVIGLAMLVIVINDASFLGGVRPFDRGDDGLFYDGVGRVILQKFLARDIYGALEGGEKVFYYGGPGLRYFRALEHVVFGESYLGYLSLVLLLPFLTYALARRFLPERWALAFVLIFTAIPVGELFGSTFIDYAKWAARGFADPAAQILLLWGLWVIVGPREGGGPRVAVAVGGALLFALAVFTKPIVAPIAGIVLAGAGLAALAQRQWRRLGGMCIGFLPVLVMPLHNWYFGHAFVLLSSNARLPGTYVMPPSAYLSALGELLRLNFSGAYLHQAVVQIGAWLSEPSQSLASIPFNVAAAAIVVYVTVRGRDFDPWLRLIGGAVLAEYVVDMIYAATPRYFFEMWLLTALIVVVFVARRLPGCMQKPSWQRAEQTLRRFFGYRPAEAS